MSENYISTTTGLQGQFLREIPHISRVLDPAFGANPCQDGQALLLTEFPAQFQGDSTLFDLAEAKSPLSYSLEPEKLKRRPGRPSTLEWYDPRKRKLGNLKISRAVSRKNVRRLFLAAAHAPRIGRALNALVTLRPDRIERVAPVDRAEFWREEKNRISQFFRDRDDHMTYICGRESHPLDGSGEHLHLLLHVPLGWGADFKRRILPHYDRSGEFDMRPASTIARWTKRGKHRSVVGYIIKNLNPNAQPGTNLSRVPGDPIVGVRVGCSRDLEPKAIAAWEAINRLATR